MYCKNILQKVPEKGKLIDGFGLYKYKQQHNMELSDILKHIDDLEVKKQRTLSKNNITVRISENDLDALSIIKSERSIKTSAAIKEAIDFYSQMLAAENKNKNNNQ